MKPLERTLYAEARVRTDPRVPLRYQGVTTHREKPIVLVDVGLYEPIEISYAELLDRYGSAFLTGVILLGNRVKLEILASGFRSTQKNLEIAEHATRSLHRSAVGGLLEYARRYNAGL